jgi:hypothetical protein
MNSTLGHRNRITSNRAGNVFVLAAALVVLAAGSARAAKATKVFHNPFSGNSEVPAMISHGGDLYIAAGGLNTLRIFRLNNPTTMSWTDVTPKLKAGTDSSEATLESFGGQLFLATREGEVFRLAAKSSSATKVSQFAAVSDMAVFGGKLYALAGDGLRRTSNGTQWENLGEVIKKPSDVYADGGTLEVHGGQMYMGFGFQRFQGSQTGSGGKYLEHGIQIWQTSDGKSWKLLKKVAADHTKPLLEDAPQHVHAMKSFGKYLYIGEYEGSGGAVFRTTGSAGSWEVYQAAPFGAIEAVEEHGGRLFAGRLVTKSTLAGNPMLYHSVDGKQWSVTPGAPAGDKQAAGIMSIASHNGKLYFGTRDKGNGGEVFELAIPPAYVELAKKPDNSLLGQLPSTIDPSDMGPIPEPDDGMTDEIPQKKTDTGKKPDDSSVSPQPMPVGPATGMQPTGKSGLHGRVFSLDTTGEVTGVVAGAKIEWKGQNGQTIATVSSNQYGYYSANLTPGVYYFKVTARGYKDEDVRRGVAVQLADGYGIYDFSLTPGKTDPKSKPDPVAPVAVGKLTGYVLERTPEGKLIGIPQAIVTLRNESARPPRLNVTAGQAGGRNERPGRYGVTLEAGSWQAAAAAPGFAPLIEAKPIHIVAGRQQTHDFVLTRSQPEPPPTDQGIRGTVWVRGPDREKVSLAQVKVSVLPVRGQSLEPRGPDTKGKYDCSVTAGSYRVTAKLKGYRTARSQPRTVFPGKYTVVDLTLVPVPKALPPTPVPPAPVKPALIAKVSVYLKTDDDVTPEQPLQDADVLLRVSGESLAAARKVTTDRDGVAVFEKLETTGTYEAVAHHGGLTGSNVFSVSKAGPNHTKIVLAKAAPIPVEPIPEPGTPLLVRVVGPRDEKVRRAKVRVETGELDQDKGRIFRGPEEIDTRTGVATFHVPRGQYWVSASDGTDEGATQVPPKWNPAEPIVVRLGAPFKSLSPEPAKARLLRIEVVAQDERGRLTPVEWADFSVEGLPRGDHAKITKELWRPGLFTTRLPAGAYRVFAERPGYPPATARVEIADRDTSCRLVFRRHGEGGGPPDDPREPDSEDLVRLRVKVVNANGRALPGAVVRLNLGSGLAPGQKPQPVGRDGLTEFQVPRNDWQYWVSALMHETEAEKEVPIRWWRTQRRSGEADVVVRLTLGEREPEDPRPEELVGLRVKVVDANGRALRGAVVRLNLGSGMARGQEPQAVGGNGIAEFRVPRNDWQYWVSAFMHEARGEAEVPRRWWQARRDEADVVVRIPVGRASPGGPGPGEPAPEDHVGLRVKVVNAKGQPLPRAVVALNLGPGPARGQPPRYASGGGIAEFRVPRTDWQYWIKASYGGAVGEQEVPRRWWQARRGDADVVVRIPAGGGGSPGGPKPPPDGPQPPPKKPDPPPMQSVDVRVVEAGSPRGVPSARVTVMHGDGPFREARPQHTDGHGHTRFHLPHGSYWLLVSARGYREGRGPLAVPKRRPEDGLVRLARVGGSGGPGSPPPPPPPKKAELTVQVVDGRGRPMGGANVRVHGPQPGGGPTDGGGHWRASLNAGTYSITVSRQHYHQQTRHGVVLRPGQHVHQRFTLTGGIR